jgi:hypothetical protein
MSPAYLQITAARAQESRADQGHIKKAAASQAF